MAKKKKSTRKTLTPAQRRYNKAISAIKSAFRKQAKQGFVISPEVTSAIPAFIKAGEKKYPTAKQVTKLKEQFQVRELKRQEKITRPIDDPEIGEVYYANVYDKLYSYIPKTHPQHINRILAEMEYYANRYGKSMVGFGCAYAISKGSDIMVIRNYDIWDAETTLFLNFLGEYMGNPISQEQMMEMDEEMLEDSDFQDY